MKIIFIAVNQQHSEGREAAAGEQMDLGDLGPPGEHEEFLFLPHYCHIPNKWDTTFIFPFKSSAIT